MSLNDEKPLGTYKRRWMIVLGFALLVLGLSPLFYAIFLDVTSPNADSYNTANDKADRVLQNIMCPEYISVGGYGFVFTDIHHLLPDEKLTITVSIDAPEFHIQQDTTFMESGVSDNVYLTPSWMVSPRRSGKHEITISAVADNGMLNKLTCSIIAINIFGLKLETLMNIGVYCFLAGLIFVTTWFRERRLERQ